MTDFPHGTPSWVELNVNDTDAAAAFYSALFDWTATEPGPVDETGGYRMFMRGEAPVAGLMPIQQPMQPVAWQTYISVDDADEIEKKVTAASGSTLVPPMDVMDIGRMAFFADPAGAAFGVWQPRAFTGAGVVNEPVSLCWNEVLTRDKAAILAFYPAVFGWTAGAPSFASAEQYTLFTRADGGMVAGGMEMNDEWYKPEETSRWDASFAVADTDAIVAHATELGATITMPAMDCPIGRFAGIQDPQGARFGIMAFSNE